MPWKVVNKSVFTLKATEARISHTSTANLKNAMLTMVTVGQLCGQNSNDVWLKSTFSSFWEKNRTENSFKLSTVELPVIKSTLLNFYIFTGWSEWSKKRGERMNDLWACAIVNLQALIFCASRLPYPHPPPPLPLNQFLQFSSSRTCFCTVHAQSSVCNSLEDPN